MEIGDIVKSKATGRLYKVVGQKEGRKGYLCDAVEREDSQYYFFDEEVDIVSDTTEKVSTPKTNADRIRAMSDEELAEFLKTYFTCEYECAAAKEACICDCNGAIMEWLQSEVEE